MPPAHCELQLAQGAPRKITHLPGSQHWITPPQLVCDGTNSAFATRAVWVCVPARMRALKLLTMSNECLRSVARTRLSIGALRRRRRALVPRT